MNKVLFKTVAFMVLIGIMVVVIGIMCINDIYCLMKIGEWIKATAVAVLLSGVLWIALIGLRSLSNNYLDHGNITAIVGAHPSEMESWKWLRLAGPIATKEMRFLALKIQEVSSTETKLLESGVATAAEILNTSKNIKRLVMDFETKQRLFKKFNIRFTKTHWHNWDDSTTFEQS